MTATEAERNRRRGLAPWWRVRSWSKDLDTLILLHKSLRALDAYDGGVQLSLSARVMSAPPAELLAPPQDKVAQDEPERPLVSDQACYPAAAYLQETQPVDATCREIPGQEMTAGQMLSPDAPPAQTSPETRPSQPLAPKDGHGEAAQVQSPDVAPEHAAAGPDPAIVAIKETFRYVADAGDKAVSFFYGQLFLRQPQLRQLFPPAMDEQRDRLFHALSRIVESLATPDEMAAYLSQLGRDHRKYQVEPEMYEAVGTALLATLRAFARDAEASLAGTECNVVPDPRRRDR